MACSPRFSVIIPTLDEADAVRPCVLRVREAEPAAEVLVADGGSRDDTVRIARAAGARVLRALPGRGTQCNAGAARASGDILLFLHADTLLPPDAFHLLRHSFRRPGVLIGTFQGGFDARHWFLDLYSRLTRFDTLWTRFGDQGIAVRRSFLEALGGFPDWPLFEDVRLLQRARRVTQIHSFSGTAVTSARRFLRQGVLRQVVRDAGLMARYLLGVPAARLARAYPPEPVLSACAERDALLLFARYPRPGRVKTRLAADLGEERAAAFYRWCVERLLRETDRLGDGVARFLFYADAADADAVRRWAGPRFHLVPQQGGHLGRRMENALRTVFRHGCRIAVLVGSDVPDLDADLLQRALRALAEHDVVLGPCPDGGYYLIGMKQLHSSLFDGVPWSTGRVLDRTLRATALLGLSVCLLPERIDVDTREDLLRWEAAGGNGSTSWGVDGQAGRAASHTGR